MELHPGIRIAICDDEPAYRRILREKILQDSIRNDYEVNIREYGSGRELLEGIDSFPAEVFFLDIQMEQGGDDGIRTGRELRRRGAEGLLIYVTAFIDYVQTGYEVRAFRYLLKSQIGDMLPKVLNHVRQERSGGTYYFKTGGETVGVEKGRILYLESSGRVLRLVTGEEEYRFYDTLDHAAELLGEGFLRCHRSFLVNGDKIQKYSAGEIVLQGNIVLPISRSYAKAVRKRLMLDMR